MPVEPKQKYALKAWLKTENVNAQQRSREGGAHIRVKSGQHVMFSLPVFDTSDWQEVAAEFITEDVHAVEIYVELGHYGAPATGTAWFDDVRLEAQAAK